MAQLKSDGFRKNTIRYNNVTMHKGAWHTRYGGRFFSRNPLIMALTSTKNIVCIVNSTYRIQTCIVRTWNELRVRIHVVVCNRAPPTQQENNSLLLLSFRPMLQHSRIKHKNSSNRNQPFKCLPMKFLFLWLKCIFIFILFI